jgi:hypothetical protein
MPKDFEIAILRWEDDGGMVPNEPAFHERVSRPEAPRRSGRRNPPPPHIVLRRSVKIELRRPRMP